MHAGHLARHALHPTQHVLVTLWIAYSGWMLPAAIFQAILGSHLAQLNREDVTQVFAESLTDVTLQLYSAVLEKLPPTPSRFHYVFNLRDLSRVYEGLLRSTADTVQQPVDFLRLWRNEVRQMRHIPSQRHSSFANFCTLGSLDSVGNHQSRCLHSSCCTVSCTCHAVAPCLP